MSDDCTNLPQVNRERINALETQLSLHNDYQREAVVKATSELRERLAGMNEFRETLRDQAAHFITKREVELKLGPLEAAMHKLENKASNWEGRVYILAGLATIASGVLGSVITVAASHFLK